MRRQFLIGVAFGCGLTAAVWIAMSFFTKTTILDHSTDEFLVLGEPLEGEEPRGEDHQASRPQSHQAARIMHKCNAWYFESHAVREPIVGEAALPVIAQNSGAIECIILAANEAQLPVKFETRFSPNIEEILRSKNAQAPKD
ncbi:MAG: hypothetical protein AAF687_11415 [Pseudomonadota bacterium]